MNTHRCWFHGTLLVFLQILPQIAAAEPHPSLFNVIFTSTRLERLKEIGALAVVIAALIAFAIVCFRAFTRDNIYNTRWAIPMKPRALDPSVIQAFPRLVYGDIKTQVEVDGLVVECSVCLEEFRDDDKLKWLFPFCNHVFHIKCIDAWLSSNSTCPVCRAYLVQQEVTESKSTIIQVAAEVENSPSASEVETRSESETQVVVLVVGDDEQNIVSSKPLEEVGSGQMPIQNPVEESLIILVDC